MAGTYAVNGRSRAVVRFAEWEYWVWACLGLIVRKKLIDI